MVTLMDNPVTYSTVDPQRTINQIGIASNGKIYRYVQVSASSANACSAGRVMYATVVDGVVSDDYTGGNGLGYLAVGVGVGSIAKGSYGWILVDGEYDDILKKTGAVSTGDVLIASTTDGKVTAKASALAAFAGKIIAVATETVTAAVTTVSGIVKCL